MKNILILKFCREAPDNKKRWGYGAWREMPGVVLFYYLYKNGTLIYYIILNKIADTGCCARC
jgi:hypothetical protein